MLNGRVSKLGAPRKRPKEGTPHKKAQSGEAQFHFCLDCKKVYTAQSSKAKPPAIAAKHDDPYDRANQRATNGHGKAGAPKAPAKGGHGVKSASVDKDDSNNDKIASVGAKPWRPLPSGAKSVQDVERVARGCARRTTSRQQQGWPLESRGACPTTKQGPQLRATRAPRS